MVTTQFPNKHDRKAIRHYLFQVLSAYDTKFWQLPTAEGSVIPHAAAADKLAESIVLPALNQYSGGVLGRDDIEEFALAMLTRYVGTEQEGVVRRFITSLVAGALIPESYWEVGVSTLPEPSQPSAEPMPEEQVQPEFSKDPRKEQLENLMKLGRSTSSICCIGSPCVDTHILMLLVMVGMGRASSLSDRLLRLLIFDSQGREYLGLEKDPTVVRQAYADPDTDALIHFLDCLYLGYRELRERLALRSDRVRRGMPMTDSKATDVVCIPRWSYWSLEWKRLDAGSRKALIRRWRDNANLRLGDEVILPQHNDQVDPLAWMRAIAVNGPDENIRLLITVNVEDLSFSRAGLENDMLANFTLVAAGLHSDTDGPRYKAVDWLAKRIGGEELAGQLRTAKDWSRESNSPFMLIDNSETPTLAPVRDAFSAAIARKAMPARDNVRSLIGAA